MIARDEIAQSLLATTGQCVSCGLCLPHCPTYRETRDESESPRGRLALVRAITTRELPLSPVLLGHLDNCLLCRACERVCPSRVPYGTLMEAARREFAHPQRHPVTRLFATLVKQRYGRRLMRHFLRIFSPFVARRTLPNNILSRVTVALPPHAVGVNRKALHPAHARRRGAVGLFTGCATEIADPNVIRDAIAVLNHLGLDVHVPAKQTCCGAVHRSAGNEAAVRSAMERNRRAFAADPERTVLSCSSACSAMLAETRPASGPGSPGATHYLDINSFLAREPWAPARFVPTQPLRVYVHEVCLHRNVLRTEHDVYKLLARLPGIDAVPLPGNSLCCGAGGTYFLDHPHMADALLARKLADFRPPPDAVIVTTNTPCAMHLRAGLRARQINIEVLHPVNLVARRLGIATATQPA